MAKHTLMIVERYACTVLDEMRRMNETRNFSGFSGLVEELQSYCNRMESALEGRYSHGETTPITPEFLRSELKEFELKKDEITFELLELRQKKTELSLEVQELELNKRKVKFKKDKK